MISALLSIAIIAACLFGNRLAGNTEWKDRLRADIGKIGGKYFGMIATIPLVFGLAFALGYDLLTAALSAIGLCAWLAYGRARSPRGAFFVLTDGANGYAIDRGMYVEFYPYDGKHNAISKFFAERISHVHFDSVINSINAPRKFPELVRYGMAYGMVHHLWLYLIACIPLTIYVSPVALLFAPIMGLGGKIHAYALKSQGEEKSRAWAERVEGIMYGVTIVGVLLSGALFL